MFIEAVSSASLRFDVLQASRWFYKNFAPSGAEQPLNSKPSQPRWGQDPLAVTASNDSIVGL